MLLSSSVMNPSFQLSGYFNKIYCFGQRLNLVKKYFYSLYLALIPYYLVDNGVFVTITSDRYVDMLIFFNRHNLGDRENSQGDTIRFQQDGIITFITIKSINLTGKVPKAFELAAWW